jgi:hypothetical protein
MLQIGCYIDKGGRMKEYDKLPSKKFVDAQHVQEARNRNPKKNKNVTSEPTHTISKTGYSINNPP